MSEALRLSNAQTLLFVPGNRPERFEKALQSGADAVVIDLEDAVPMQAKDAARAHIAQALPGLQKYGVPIVVRINAVGQGEGSDDLKWLAGRQGLAAVMAPKAESAAMLAEIKLAHPGVGILPLIETAAGYLGLADIAAAPGVLRLVVGHVDFALDTSMEWSEDEVELAPLRFAVTMQSRRMGLAPAIDGVTVQLQDTERLRRDTLRARRFGFGGKLCIHPQQVGIVRECLSPTEAQLAWAQRVVAADEAAEGAAVQVDGQMIDVPVVVLARRMLARAVQAAG